jgi:hypothetical protein
MSEEYKILEQIIQGCREYNLSYLIGVDWMSADVQRLKANKLI